MKLIVLISCMHQKDYSIIEKSNVQTDAVVINQCDVDSIDRYVFKNKKGNECSVVFVNTTERGLSRSRNMAIEYANTADICLICDDDEWLNDDYEQIIINGFDQNPNFGVIAFSLIRNDVDKIYPIDKKPLRFNQIFKTSSVQIAFKRDMVRMSGIKFDEKMGSGTGNGAGEEIKFLLDCKYKKLGLYYIPDNIATLNPSDSNWFQGYTIRYYQNQGWMSRRLLGFILGYVYLLYTCCSKRRLYKENLSFFQVLTALTTGFFLRR